MEINRGDIYWVDFGANNGSIQSGTRPAIISSNDLNNRFCPNVQVIPVTSSLTKVDLPVHVYIGEDCGLTKPSLALAEAETTVSKNKVGKKIGACTPQTLRNLEKAIQIQKGITTPFNLVKAYKYLKAIQLSDGFAKDVLTQEFKNYCEEYGRNYKIILTQYKNDNIVKSKEIKKVQYA